LGRLATSMTLPIGYKTFVDDVVLPADEINGYLMQGILVFTDASDRDTSLVGNLREGQYAYLQSDKTTYVYSGTAWQRVGKQDVETTKNFQSFTASGGTSVPDWATKMYYVIVKGGVTGQAGTNVADGFTGGGAGGNGGEALQGNTAVTGGTSLTITVGGTNANSSVAISGGSTFTAAGAGGAGGAAQSNGGNGLSPSAPFNVARYGGGGGGGNNAASLGIGFGGDGGGGSGGVGNGQAGEPNTGGGGGGGAGFRTSVGTPAGSGGTGGSGIVLLYFS
jgi:hypothetical protein